MKRLNSSILRPLLRESKFFARNRWAELSRFCKHKWISVLTTALTMDKNKRRCPRRRKTEIEERYPFYDRWKSENDTPSASAHPPEYIRRSAEFFCPSPNAPISFTGIYYGSVESSGKESDKPSDHWVLLTFSHLVQPYLTCCGSMSESNVSE